MTADPAHVGNPASVTCPLPDVLRRLCRPWVQGQWCCWANNLTSPYLIHTCLPLSLFLLGQVWCCKWQTIYWLGVLTSERSASSCMYQATTRFGNLWHHPPPALNNLEHGVVGLSKDQWLSPDPPSHTLHNTACTYSVGIQQSWNLPCCEIRFACNANSNFCLWRHYLLTCLVWQYRSEQEGWSPRW